MLLFIGKLNDYDDDITFASGDNLVDAKFVHILAREFLVMLS